MRDWFIGVLPGLADSRSICNSEGSLIDKHDLLVLNQERNKLLGKEISLLLLRFQISLRSLHHSLGTEISDVVSLVEAFQSMYFHWKVQLILDKLASLSK